MSVPPKPAIVTTLTDEQWKNASLSERFIHVMRSQDLVEEYPKGSNWGPVVKLYLKLCGFDKPAAWCVALVTYSLCLAGVDIKKLPKYPASTYYWIEWAIANNILLDKPKRGCIIVWNNGKPGGHGFGVTHYDSITKTVKTIEGNSNSDGSREGWEVVDHERKLSQIQKQKRYVYIDVDAIAKL